MKSRAIIAIVMALVLATSVSGCGRRSRATATTQTEVKTTTTGQELMDLKKAYDSGAITEKEYERQRKKILEGK